MQDSSTRLKGRRCLALMYHEVIAGEPPKGADPYKLGESDFRAHVAAIRQAIGDTPVRTAATEGVWAGGARPVFLTFDDGDASGYTIAAALLEEAGWRGHFFITTDFIGRPGFMTRPQIAELHRRGHLIGSHSCSHPVPMSRCPVDRLRHEWSESVATLSDITGARARVASVPGGYYSRKVEETAIEAGIELLFTSEPTDRVTSSAECSIVGRYALKRGMGPEVAAAFAAGRVLPRWKEAAWWNAKKILKRANLRAYLKVREALIGA